MYLHVQCSILWFWSTIIELRQQKISSAILLRQNCIQMQQQHSSFRFIQLLLLQSHPWIFEEAKRAYLNFAIFLCTIKFRRTYLTTLPSLSLSKNGWKKSMVCYLTQNKTFLSFIENFVYSFHKKIYSQKYFEILKNSLAIRPIEGVQLLITLSRFFASSRLKWSSLSNDLSWDCSKMSYLVFISSFLSSIL